MSTRTCDRCGETCFGCDNQDDPHYCPSCKAQRDEERRRRPAMFDHAVASVIGRDHAIGKNNQDAAYVTTGQPGMPGDDLIAVVCDGCGSTPHSEVGAKLGARLIAAQLRRLVPQVTEDQGVQHLMERVRLDTLAQLRMLANAMGGRLNEVIEHYFLFTIVGIVITPNRSWTFSIGDGVIFLNGERVDPGPTRLLDKDRNSPTYLAYGIMSPGSVSASAKLDFNIHTILSTQELQSFLIATDGADHLIAHAKDKIPGQEELVGDIGRLWQEDRFFENPDMLRRFLTLANRDHTKIDYDERKTKQFHGHLKDDTTIIVGRRRPSS
jgi:serine/threonine protein phosphatase PrpC